MDCTKTLKLRIKDKHANVLRQMAREVNQVWNHINAISAKAARPFHGKPQFLSGYDLQKFTAGFSKCDDVSVGSGTVQLVCVEYATRRKQFKKTRLNWRVSNPKSAKYSLGWIPFKGGHAKYKAGQIHFAGQKLSLWDSYGLADYELRAGSFSEDSRGRWYLNVVVKVQAKASAATASVGIDLGLKEAAVASDAQRIQGRFYRKLEARLGIAQRAGKKCRVKAIHAKIKNQRKDMLHKFSTATNAPPRGSTTVMRLLGRALFVPALIKNIRRNWYLLVVTLSIREIQTMAPLLWTAVRETGSVLHMERQDRLRWFCGIRGFSEFWFDKTQQAHRLQDLPGRHAVWCAAVIAHSARVPSQRGLWLLRACQRGEWRTQYPVRCYWWSRETWSRLID